MNYKMYKELIFNEKVTCRNIMKNVDMPSSLFKYRCFCRNTDKGIEEDPYWKESMDGIFFCSLAKDFNRNDPEDCKLEYDKSAIRDAIFEQLEYTGKIDCSFVKHVDNKMQNYITSIRDNFRIGCFTTSLPEEQNMWDDPNFGGNNTGYCIEYCVSKDIMFPGTIILLPVLYDAARYDSTKVFCNLIKNDGKVDTFGVIALAYNFSLIKIKSYAKEKEWRLIVTKNKYDKYFNFGEGKVDFSKIMKAIYLGKDYKKNDLDGKKYKYALNTCKLRNIPLYEMVELNGKLIRKCVYNPIIV